MVQHIWLNNGDIIHKRAHSSRMVFLETENLDPLYRGIEQIIGVPIEHMVITANRRAQCVYLRSFVPDKVLEKIRKKEMDYESVDAAIRRSPAWWKARKPIQRVEDHVVRTPRYGRLAP